jgi:anti-sigma factor RsiW
MTDHLPASILSALADGELSADQLATANQHLSQCPSCTKIALHHSLLKSATGKAGQRFSPAPDFHVRLTKQIRGDSTLQGLSHRDAARPTMRVSRSYGWAIAITALLLLGGIFFVQYSRNRSATGSTRDAALAVEICDLHIAMLAANTTPEVISSDRHTVKPWFQGKLPFSFNLPDNLPSDITLDGANLTYIQDRPTAQLLYSIGKHRVSVYLQQRTSERTSGELPQEYSGFHIVAFSTSQILGIAVSDVDAARLSDLAGRIDQAQTENAGTPK